MCLLYIDNYTNRTANHLLSIINFFFNAHILPLKNETLFKQYTIRPHPLFHFKEDVPKPDQICSCTQKINLSNKLYSHEKINLHTMKKIYEQFIHAPEIDVFDDIPVADIAIHIRSGDIFLNNVHPYYAQPCLNFYISLCKPNLKIYVVYENELNPVIPLLKEHCEKNNLTNVLFFSNHVNRDIYILSRAKKLVFSNATFCVAPFVISKTIQHVLIPHTVDKHGFHVNGENIFPISFHNYTNHWKNNEEQKKIMKEYVLYDDAVKVINQFIQS